MCNFVACSNQRISIASAQQQKCAFGNLRENNISQKRSEMQQQAARNFKMFPEEPFSLRIVNVTHN